MTRQRREEKSKPWVVGFAGSSSKTSQDNVKELLNVFIPIEQDIKAIIPDSIKRTQRMLMYTWNWLDGQQGENEDDLYEPYEYEKVPVGNLVQELLDAQSDGHQVYLVLAYDEDKDYDIASNALVNCIPVKDLTAGMDDLQISEPADEEEEAEKPRRQRGKPRGEVVEAETTGPATIVDHQQAAEPAIQALGVALHNFVVEILDARLAAAATAGLVANLEAKLDEPIRAFTNDDGDYELAGDRKRKNGWKLVKLSRTEAEELGLV